mgnify:CR=1 FL=1
MHFNKRYILLLILSLVLAMPIYGQRFTKKEQAKREARAKNYFYGHSFTLSAGLNHSWLTKDEFEDLKFGLSGAYQDTHNSFDLVFSWDMCFNKYYGYQLGLGYMENGGRKVMYHDNGFGYGPQLREDLSDKIRAGAMELQGAFRGFLPLTYKSRLTGSVGVFLDKRVGSSDYVRNWDLGLFVGIGYDWKHLSANVIYKPGLNTSSIEGCNSRAAAVMFNIGVRMWK